MIYPIFAKNNLIDPKRCNILRQKITSMKYLLFILCSCFWLNLFSQENDSYLRLTFIKAKEGSNYRENLTQKFARLHQQRIEDGIINGWDLWQVVNSRQTPFSHIIVTLTDISKMDSLYSGVNMQKVFPDMTNSDIETFYKNNITSRNIIGDYIITNVKNISKNNSIPDEFMVINFMKVKEGKFKTFEDMEIDLTTEAMTNEKFRTGWTLQKRIDKYGTDLYWNYLTIDWYSKYSDYIKASSIPTIDADKNYQSMMSIRDLRDRAVLRKVMSVR